VRDGEAVRDPADSPYAVALAVRYQRGLSIPWRKRAVYWIATLPLLAYWYWVGGLWYAPGGSLGWWSSRWLSERGFGALLLMPLKLNGEIARSCASTASSWKTRVEGPDYAPWLRSMR
jgi:hypothetical protein